LRVTPKGVELAVRVTPRARRPGLEPLVTDAAGTVWVGVRVAEPAEGGRATRAVAALVARTCGLPPRAVAVVAGAGSRWKRLRIAAPPGEVEARLRAALAAAAG
jgi:uncharacterized protein YggU (UPF0235/DUF167 family)